VLFKSVFIEPQQLCAPGEMMGFVDLVMLRASQLFLWLMYGTEIFRWFGNCGVISSSSIEFCVGGSERGLSSKGRCLQIIQ
jgi:hypothetical protein